MQLHRGTGKIHIREISITLAIVLAAVFTQPAFAAKLVGTNINGAALLYLTPPSTNVTMFSTGTKPDGIIVGPNQEIIYTVSGAGQVHIFNPYPNVDATLAKGLTQPVELVLEPGCKSILVSDIGVNKIFRINLSGGLVTTLYNGPDKIQGLTYDNLGDLFANDDSLNAVVQIDPNTGVITNQTPSFMPLTALEGLVYDPFTNQLFASSTTGQVIYEVTTDLSVITTINFPGEPFLHGIATSGSGVIYVVGSDGTTGVLFQYTISSGTQTTLQTVTGLEDIAPIPFGPCIKKPGGSAACEGE